MLETQKYLLSGKTLNDLENELGISNREHDNLPLVILNYSQIDSPKGHKIVTECRQLILEKDTWKCVSRSFPRFYNIGEMEEITNKFDWNNHVLFEKVDGSLVSMFKYDGKWRFATRSTFGNFLIPEQSFTWEDVIANLLPSERIQHLNENHTYVFEFCSPWTQVVTYFEKPKLVLLDIVPRDTVFIRRTQDEHIEACNYLADFLGVQRPEIYSNKSNPAELKAFVDSMTNQDEGCVAQDHTGLRVKAKNLNWLALAALKNNNNFYYKDLYDVVLAGTDDDVCANYPQAREKCEKLKVIILETKRHLRFVYNELKDISVQKDFALALLKEKCPMSWVLFDCRRKKLTVDEVFSLPEYYEKVKKGILEEIKPATSPEVSDGNNQQSD
jgi:hypothetical protein